MKLTQLSKFQLIFFGVLIIAIVGAVGVFALNNASNNSSDANVTIWGTFPYASMTSFLQRQEMVAALRAAKVNINYVSKNAATFDQDVVEAVASGRGPDAVLISQDAALQYLDKVIQIPYSSFNQRTFKDSFIQESELFLTTQGIEALPFTIDPMVMYWNRTLFANAGIANPPTLWSQLYTPDGAVAKINKVDVNHNILKTAVSLGTYANIFHAKDLLSLLTFQAGSQIVGADSNGVLKSTLNTYRSTDVQSSATAALSFYTQFADPAKNLYSWNAALPLSRDAFTSGDLALYFGYASELNNLYARNPNLNFDVALMPQSQSSTADMTFGKVYGLAILKSASSIVGAAKASMLLSSSASQGYWSEISGLPPVTRDLLAQKPASPFMTVFYKAALQSRGWLDPNRTATDSLFSDMVSSVLSGSKTANDAVRDGDLKLNQLLNAYSK